MPGHLSSKYPANHDAGDTSLEDFDGNQGFAEPDFFADHSVLLDPCEVLDKTLINAKPLISIIWPQTEATTTGAQTELQINVLLRGVCRYTNRINSACGETGVALP